MLVPYLFSFILCEVYRQKESPVSSEFGSTNIISMDNLVAEGFYLNPWFWQAEYLL